LHSDSILGHGCRFPLRQPSEESRKSEPSLVRKVSEAKLVDEIVDHLRETIDLAQELKNAVSPDDPLWVGLCEIQALAHETWARVIPLRP
jgi:hypothetical protein